MVSGHVPDDLQLPYHLGRIAGGYAVRRYVFDYHAAGSDYYIIADSDIAYNGDGCSEINIVAYNGTVFLSAFGA